MLFYRHGYSSTQIDFRQNRLRCGSAITQRASQKSRERNFNSSEKGGGEDFTGTGCRQVRPLAPEAGPEIQRVRGRLCAIDHLAKKL